MQLPPATCLAVHTQPYSPPLEHEVSFLLPRATQHAKEEESLTGNYFPWGNSPLKILPLLPLFLLTPPCPGFLRCILKEKSIFSAGCKIQSINSQTCVRSALTRAFWPSANRGRPTGDAPQYSESFKRIPAESPGCPADPKQGFSSASGH